MRACWARRMAVSAGNGIAGFDGVHDGAMFQLCGFAAFPAGAPCWLEKKHSRLNIFQHFHNVAVMRTIIDSFVEAAVVVRQLSRILKNLFLRLKRVAQRQSFHVGRIARDQCRRS